MRTQAIQLWNSGRNLGEIAEELNVSVWDLDWLAGMATDVVFDCLERDAPIPRPIIFGID